MKKQSHLLSVVAATLLLSALACTAGGSAGNAPTPTLISLSTSASSGGSAAQTEVPSGSSSAQPAAQGGAVPICSLMTNDEAAAILGGTVTSGPRQGGEAGRRFINCEYKSGAQSLTVQGGSAEQAKELLMAAAYNMQQMKADAAEQKVIDDTMVNLSKLTLKEVGDRIFPQYTTPCLTVNDITGVGDGGRWITCQRLHYAAVAAHRGQSEDQLVFLDIVWLGSTLSDADTQARLVAAVNTGLSRLPAGSTTVMGN